MKINLKIKLYLLNAKGDINLILSNILSVIAFYESECCMMFKNNLLKQQGE